MNRILDMSHVDYISSKAAAGDTQALTDLVAMSILVETLILYTVMTLHEEEMAVHTPSYPHPLLGLLVFFSLNHGAIAATFFASC